MNRALSAAAIAALLGMATACSDGTGRITVKLTDATGPFEAAVVTISKISLQGEGGETVLMGEPATVDLLTLANQTATLLEDVVVPTGRYTELRFQITGGYVKLASTGEIFASSPTYEGLPEGATVAGLLKMPSYGQSGLKVTLPGDALVVQAESKVLLVDFDVAQSFGHEAGGSGSWVMHPVVRGADITLSGNVVATLRLAPGVTLPTVNGTPVTLALFSAVLKNEGGSAETLPFADAGGGVFMATFQFLLPGSYTVDVTGPAGVTFETTPAHPLSLTVGEGTDAHADFTVTSASAP